MRKIILAMGVAAMALSMPASAQGQGSGKSDARPERGKSGDRGENPRRGREGGPGAGRPDRGAGERRGGPPQRAMPPGRAQAQDNPAAARGNLARPEREKVRPPRGQDRPARDVRGARREIDRGRGPADARGGRGWGRIERRAVAVSDPARLARFTPPRQRGLIAGCPPGLARQGTGCLPPGIARQLVSRRAWYDDWWRYRGEGVLRYREGYLYRLRPDGVVSGFLPLAGGALWLGNSWPANYAFDPVPAYYPAYYGYDDPYDYRYADGILYGVDPETAMIRQIAALLTGADWTVGGRMPAGYDIYNVPYSYRDQYYDTPDSWYRYNDGYIYRVDPTTQLIQAAIQLLA